MPRERPVIPPPPVPGGTPLTVTVGAGEEGDRLDRALARGLSAAGPEVSRSRIKGLIEGGQVSTGGETIRDPAARVKPGQTFAVFLPEPEPATPAAQPLPLEIVYEDADVIVVDKPAGLVVHPAPGNPDRTLVNALIAHCGDSLSGIGGERRPGIVHRLDKDTAGLLVAAKNDLAHHALARQFAEHSVERVYQALVWGVPQPLVGEIAGPIGRSTQDRKRMAVRARGGKPALTRYRVLRTYAQGAVSLVECRLATGRTHQVRVHLAHRGHSVLGDPLYGRGRGRGGLDSAALAAIAALPGQALVAMVLGFTHPRTCERLKFDKNLPESIRGLVQTLEASEKH